MVHSLENHLVIQIAHVLLGKTRDETRRPSRQQGLAKLLEVRESALGVEVLGVEGAFDGVDDVLLDFFLFDWVTDSDVVGSVHLVYIYISILCWAIQQRYLL